jgi:hypothetical protein
MEFATLDASASIGGAVRMAQLARTTIDAGIVHGGSFPIATTLPRAQAEACYPRLRAPAEKRQPIRPAITNARYARYRSLLYGESVEVRWGR